MFGAAAALLAPATAWSLECAPPPPAIAVAASASVETWASALVDAAAHDRLSSEADRVDGELRAAHPDVDEVIARLALDYAACERLARDPVLGETERRQRMVALEQRAFARRAADEQDRNGSRAPLTDDDYVELDVVLRTAADAPQAPALGVTLVVEGTPVARVLAQRPGAGLGDLRRIRMRLPQPVPVSDCRDLALDVALLEDSPGFSPREDSPGFVFNLTRVELRTRRGRSVYNAFAPEGPLELGGRRRSVDIDIRFEGCELPR